MSNYDNLLRSKENEIPLDNSAMEKSWASMEQLMDNDGVKPPKKGKLRKLFRAVIATTVIAVIGFLGYKKMKEYKHSHQNIEAETTAIKPMMKEIDVPYESFEIDNALGDTLFTKNGSILIFPKNAIVDNDGKIVTGKVQIRSREFNDPIDFAVAGIPMQYDSAGVKYTFVSSGMIDINAFQNGNALKVNPNAKPTLNLVSTSDAASNLYQLNAATGVWQNKGSVEIIDVRNGQQTNRPQTTVNKASKTVDFPTDIRNVKPEAYDGSMAQEIIKPEPPRKASGTKPVIEIQIDPESFAELKVYNNMKFEVVGGDAWNPKDSEVEWNNVELKTITTGKMYNVTFTKGQRKLTYITNPVLEGNDYNNAVAAYDKKLAKYEAQINATKDNWDIAEKQAQKKNTEIEAKNQIITQKRDSVIKENDRIVAMNKLIEMRNELIAKRNIEIEAQNKLMLYQQRRNTKYLDSIIKVNDEANKAYQLKVDNERKRIAEEKRVLDSTLNSFSAAMSMTELQNKIIRSFTIDGFGYWNCDQPTIPKGTIFVGNFVDEEGKPIVFTYMNAASQGVNRLLAYYNATITVMPNVNHIMWTLSNNNFYYITLKDYAKLNITAATKTATITMRQYKGKATTINELKKAMLL
jgi:hypothetical protein